MKSQFLFNNSLLVVLDFYQRLNCFIVSVSDVDEFLTDESVSHILEIDKSDVKIIFQITTIFEIDK